MKKKLLAGLGIAVTMIILGLFIYPHITIQTDDKLIACRYSDDFSEFETEVSSDERYTYYEERDITWSNFAFHKSGPFYVLIFDIEEGNTIQSKYALTPEYIDDFLSNAEIEVVEKDYKEIDLHTDDIAAMLAGKKALHTAKTYTCPNYDQAFRIYYQLDDAENIMYIYETEGVLVIQVGYPDESPKYIAYR